MSSEGTPLHGDRGAWNVITFDTEHAKDIMDSTLRRHLPLPGAVGGYARSDGTDWQRVNSIALADLADYSPGFIIVGGAADWEAAAFDWDTLSAGAGADMVHGHGSAAEGGTLGFDILTGDCDLADLADYVQGSIIRGGAADWEAYAHPGVANRVLQSTAAEVGWSATAVTFPAAGAVPVGSGAANQIAYWSAANTLTSDAGLMVDAANDLFIVADGGGVAIGAALERIIFDTAGYVSVMGAWLGVGILVPTGPLDIMSGTHDQPLKLMSTDNRARIHLADHDTTVYIVAEGSALSMGFTSTIGVNNLNVNAAGDVTIGALALGYKLGVAAGTSDGIFVGDVNDGDNRRAFLGLSPAADGLLELDNRYETTEVRIASRANSFIKYGNLGLGLDSPQGKLHGYDAISGFLHWEYDGLAGAAQTVIPNAAGDVTSGVTIMYRIHESGGGTDGNLVMVLNGASVDLYDDGTDVCTLTVAATGAVTVVRSAGAATFKVALWLLWI